MARWFRMTYPHAAPTPHPVRSDAAVQAPARHAKLHTTLKPYTKLMARDFRGALESLHAQPARDDAPEALAATGTDGERMSRNLDRHLPIVGDGDGRGVSDAGELTPAGARERDSPERLTMGVRASPIVSWRLSSGERVMRTRETGFPDVAVHGRGGT